MQGIIFDKAKENHSYAIRNDKGQLELVKEPVKGEKYFEFAVVAGGAVDYCEHTRPPRDTICQKKKGHKGRHRAVIFWESERK